MLDTQSSAMYPGLRPTNPDRKATTMQSLTITWDPDTGAEPSHIFNKLNGTVYEVRLDVPYDPVPIVFDRLRLEDDGSYTILGWVVDDDGVGGDPIDIPLDTVRSIHYL